MSSQQDCHIARWLEQIATSMNETCCYIPNGLDFAQFGVLEQPGEALPRTCSDDVSPSRSGKDHRMV